MKIRHRLLMGGASLLVLMAVFSLYTRPEFLMTLAGQLWSCF